MVRHTPKIEWIALELALCIIIIWNGRISCINQQQKFEKHQRLCQKAVEQEQGKVQESHSNDSNSLVNDVQCPN